MRKVFSGILLFLTIFMPIKGAAFEKNKVAVLDFQVQGAQILDKDLGKIISEWLITTLVKDGRFELVERRLLDKILNEQKLELTGLVSSADISAIGNLLQANSVITGTINSLAGEISINARIIEVRNGTIIKAEHVKARDLHDLERATYELTRKLINNFPLLGYVVKRKGEKVSIDLGNVNGIKMGMAFQVYAVGEVIKHPKTDEIIDQERIVKGEVIINDVREHISKAEITRQLPGQAIKYGDRVEMIKKSGQGKSVIINGNWQAFSSDDAHSSYKSGQGGIVVWQYDVDTIGDDTFAGINLETNAFSIRGKKLSIELNSTQGRSIWVRPLSFMDSYSKRDDEDTFVPADIRVILKKGRQVVDIDPSQLQIPKWWLKEKRAQGKVEFALDKIVGIDIEADVDEDVGAVGDTITIYGVSLQ